MRRGRIFLLLALVVVIGIVIVYFVFQNVLPKSTSGPTVPIATAVPKAMVVVVAQRIDRGTIINATQLISVPYPSDMLYEGLITDMSLVVGRRAKYDLDPPVILNRSMLVDNVNQLSRTGSDIALLIDPGKVAVSIPISRLSSVSFAPERGDHVNVIVTLLMVDIDPEFQSSLPNNTAAVIAPGPNVLVGGGTGDNATANLSVADLLRNLTAQSATGGSSAPKGRAEADALLEQTFYVVPSEPQRPRLVSQTLIQDVMVLQIGTVEKAQAMKATPAAGATPQPTSTPLPGQTTTAPVVPPAPDLITLVVSPQDAVTLNYLIYAGAQITLALRGAGDDSRVSTESVTLQFLLDQYNINFPLKTAYGLQPRIDELKAPSLRNDITPTPQR